MYFAIFYMFHCNCYLLVRALEQFILHNALYKCYIIIYYYYICDPVHHNVTVFQGEPDHVYINCTRPSSRPGRLGWVCIKNLSRIGGGYDA